MSIIYDGIALPYPLTTRFDQQTVYDDSKTDWMCTKFDIQIQAVLNIKYMDTIAPEFANAATNPNNAGAIMRAIRTRLLRPRRSLSYMVNDEEMIPPSTAGEGTVDAMNGPQPQSCSITLMTNVTFLITYHIIAHYWENVDIDPDTLEAIYDTGNNVLSNRWEESIVYNDVMAATRYRHGKYVIRSDNADGFTVDGLRPQMAVVGVPAGFVRIQSEYKIDPGGLIMQYSIADKQVFKMPPQPAYKAQGTYTETTTKMGAIKFGEVHLRLEGCPNSDICSQDTLLEVAMAIAGLKLQIRGFTQISSNSLPGPGVTQVPITRFRLLHFASVTVGMFENVVEVRARCQFNAQNGRTQGFDGFNNKDGTLTETPLSSLEFPPQYFMRGTDNILLQAAKYYDPSLKNLKMTPSNNFTIIDSPEAINDINSVPVDNFSDGIYVGEAGVIQEE